MKDNFEIKVGYGLGIISIILAFISAIGGLVAGIIGLKISKGYNDDLAKKAKKLNKIGIMISIILIVITIISIIILKTTNLGNFPLV
jgi:hypothetical protein